MDSRVYDVLRQLISAAAGNVLAVLQYPFNPGERVFVLYLFTSFVFAAAVHRLSHGEALAAGPRSSLRQFLFPDRIWRTPSAWLDVRYFFFHQILRVWLYSGFVLLVSDWVFGMATGVSAATARAASASMSVSWPIALAYGVCSIVALDFAAYLMHYCQHRVPFLWEFHRVHHSATVMHPLTNYREHPVDNIVYAVGLGACTGAVMAAASVALGYVPTQPTILGVGLLAFAFNGLGYHLRHSHIWLRWPGPLVYLFGCPAHHQVHHSYHPTHINKNFAFMLPVWDLLFGTFEMPESNKDVKFGLGERTEDEFRSCLGLYFVPFRRLLRRRRVRQSECTAPAPADYRLPSSSAQSTTSSSA